MPPAVTTDDDATEATDLKDAQDEAFGDEFEETASAALADEEGEEPSIALEDGESLDDELEGEEESEGVRDVRVGEEPAKGEAKTTDVKADRGDGRNAKGEFVPKKEDAQSAAPAAGAAAAPAVAQAEAPKWDPYTVRAEKDTVPLDGVQVSRKDGYAIIAMPEKALGRFNERIARGHIAERVWRELKRERENFEFEKSAPPRRSDSEIEAQILADAMKPHMADFLSDEQIANLELRIELAKRDEAAQYAKAEGDRRSQMETESRAREESANEPMVALDWLRQEFLHVLGQPQYGMGPLGLSEKEVTEVFHELVPVLRAVIYRDGNDWYSQRDIIVNKLRQKAGTRSGVSAKAEVTAAPAALAANTATAKAERFNRQQDTAAGQSPASTSVKANRQPTGQRPRSGSPARPTRQPPRVSPAERAEDNWNQKKKSYFRSNTLDFEDDDEG